MSRAERLLAMLQYLRHRRLPTTAATLAAEFSVCERTVYRDLASLAAQGAGISGAPGLGYILSADHFLPPLMLDALEADAVRLGLRFVMQRGDPALVPAARATAAKIAAVLPEAVERSARLNGLAVAPAGDAHPLLGLVRAAIRRERPLALDYCESRNVASSRTVWPVVVGFFDGCEVLAAWCELRGAFRHFRLDRIHDGRLLERRPSKPHRLLLAEWHRQNSEVEF